MKIHTIEHLNHARFRNFSWDSSVQPFCDTLNILFGWNGSGKTTLSNFFRSFETGATLGGCSFKIKTDSTTYSDAVSANDLRQFVRVFNDDYIERTLKGSKIPYIFFAGKEAVDYSSDESMLEEKRKDLSNIILPTNHDQIARSTAAVIREVAGINSCKKEMTNGNYSSYDKSDFEKRIRSIQAKIKNKDIPDHTALIRKDINALKKQLINSDRVAKNNGDIANSAHWRIDNIDKLNTLLESTPIQEWSKRIGALNEKQVAWVEEGVSIHFGVAEKLNKCIFCNSDIHNAEELLKHFSEDVVRATNDVDQFIRQAENYISTLTKLESPTSTQTTNAAILLSNYKQIVSVLGEKRNAIVRKINPLAIITSDLIPLTNVAGSDTTTIAYAIETHFVAQQYQNYEQAYIELKTADDKKSALQEEIRDLDERVRTLKQKAKNTHEPASALNALFKIVFPYRKIEISDSDDGTGYALKRDGANCSFASLSEGEKNFIALAYFIYSINDAQNKLADDGIVMIDDPVSSLDKLAIFQIFSIIVNEIKKNRSRQYFLFTHNLDFLSHLKELFGKAIDHGKARLMSLSATNGGCTIGDIDPLLKNHRSDYYYVFGVLYKFKDACSLEDSYLVVNLLRRWLETFLEFKFSTSGDLQSTLEHAYSNAHKATEKWATPFSASHLEMYRFINHGSHGFPDVKSTDESVLTNANVRIQEAFELVKILDPMHYNKLEGLSKN